MADETEAERKLRVLRERRQALEASIRDGSFGKTQPAKPAPAAPRMSAPSPRDVPMGNGSIGRARNAIAGRAQSVDDAVEAAQKGSLSGARRPSY